MSVTFYDQNNPSEYNEDGDQVGGGIEVNFNNWNAYNILLLMGLCAPQSIGMFGEIDGITFRKCCVKAIATIEMICSKSSFNDYNTVYYLEVKVKIQRLLTVFSESETVCWS